MVFKYLPRRFEGLAAVALAASLLAGSAGVADAANKRRQAEPEPPPPTLAGPAVLAVVSINHQRVALYDAAGNVLRANVSSGQTGYETPVGIYSVLQKEEEHHSNLYDDASMPFMQRITWSGIALHAGALPGYPASHGCVRLPLSFAKNIFGQTRLGLRVVVAGDDVAPISITHPALFQPAPPAEVTARATPTAFSPADEAEAGNPFAPDLQNWPTRQREAEVLKAVAVEKAAAARIASEKAAPFAADLKKKTAETSKALRDLRAAEAAKKKAEDKLAKVSKWLDSAKRPREIKQAEAAKAKAETALTNAESVLSTERVKAQPATEILNAATEAANNAEAERAAAVKAAKDAEHRLVPISVFISRATKRLYIRQGYEPMLDVPVEIRDPDRPIGTHVFTAIDYADGGNSMRWNAVSLARPKNEYVAYNDYDDEDYYYPRRKRRVATSDAPPPPTDEAAAAAALDRITIPPEILERVSMSVWPGSSLIISDEDASKETGKATDFIVLVSGYPQGGIKKRKKQQPDYWYDDDDYYYSNNYRDRRRRSYGGKGIFGFW